MESEGQVVDNGEQWNCLAQGQYWQDMGDEHEFQGVLAPGGMDWNGTNLWTVQVGGNQAGSWLGKGRHNQGSRESKPKRRFCTSYPEVANCRRGMNCAFAHCREEISAPLLEMEEELQDPEFMTDSFFMYKYKTRWCPVGVQHEWHTCVYAHNYQDARRPVEIGYGARLCPYWSKKDTGAEYSQRCPLGLRCPYSHGAKEQLYHPHYFKTVVCRDMRGKICPRHKLCAFFHMRTERRQVTGEEIDYSQPLKSEDLPEDWVTDFLAPPFLPEPGKTQEASEKGENIMDASLMTYAGQMAPTQFGQMPCVFLMPFGQMMPPLAPNGEGMARGLAMPAQAAMNGMNWVFVPGPAMSC